MSHSLDTAPPEPAQRAFRELRALLALVLDTDAASIHPHTRLDDLPNWSSLTFIVVQLGIEKRFHFKLDPEQAFAACDIGGLAALIAHRPGPPG